MRMPLLTICALISSGAGFSSPVSAQERPKPEPSIPQLLHQLGADRFAEREAADKLLRSRDNIYLEVRRALPGLNAEARRRASAILEAMDFQRMKRFLQYGREGRVDVLLEWSSVVGNRLIADEFWQCVLDIGWSQLDKSASEGRPGRRDNDFPPRTMKQFRNDPLDLISDKRLLRNPTGTEVEFVRRIVVVATEPATSLGFVDGGIVLATGDVKIAYGNNVVVIADGEVQLLRTFGRTVVATRSRTASEFAHRYDRFVREALGQPVARGKEMVQYDLLYRPGEPPRRVYDLPAPEQPAELVDEKPAPRDDGLRFFEPEDVGLALALSKDRIVVAKLQSDSPLEKAGLEADDVIVAIDGNAVGDLKTARRQLRRAFVLGGAEFSISRNGKPLSLTVSFFGWDLPPVETPNE